MKRSDSIDQSSRRGFALIEVLAVVVLTAIFASIILPFAGRLIEKWWQGDALVENADGWMQLTARLSADLAQTIALPSSASRNAPLTFRGTRDGIVFIRPPRRSQDTRLQIVAYMIQRTSSGSSLVSYSASFNPSAFGADLQSLDPQSLGAATAVFSSALDLAFTAVGADGSRSDRWVDRKDLPRWIELSARPQARDTAPVGPIVLAIPARPQVAVAPGAVAGAAVTGVGNARTPTEEP